MIPMAEAALYTVERRAANLDTGQPVYTLAETLTIRASIQDVPGRVRMNLPEALRARSIMFVVADVEPVLRDHRAGGVPADLVLYDGRRWEVADRKVFPPGFPLPHAEYVIVLSETEVDPVYAPPDPDP